MNDNNFKICGKKNSFERLRKLKLAEYFKKTNKPFKIIYEIEKNVEANLFIYEICNVQ